MSKTSRNKGASYEREVCAVLSEATGKKVQRHIGQARDGGNDITVGSLVIECKRRKTLGTVEGWLKQAKAAVSSPEQTPVVVARSDGGESLAILSFADFLKLTQGSDKQVLVGTVAGIQIRADTNVPRDQVEVRSPSGELLGRFRLDGA